MIFEHLLLNDTQLETERKVVMNERRECVDDDPEAFLDEHLWALAFGLDHPYGHPTIGWMDDIKKLSLEECQAFYHTYYHPNLRRMPLRGISIHLLGFPLPYWILKQMMIFPSSKWVQAYLER